jgi:hypothetical protein
MTLVFYHIAFHPLSDFTALDSRAEAILPISVFMPVLKMTACARPLVT